MGDPWAGHVSVFGTASWAISRDKSDVPENLGAEPPTGSTQERQLTCVEVLIWDGHSMKSKKFNTQIRFFTFYARIYHWPYNMDIVPSETHFKGTWRCCPNRQKVSQETILIQATLPKTLIAVT